MANIFNLNDKSILATASITITDQTDAANLAGGISVVTGGKNQVYLTGAEANPFSPDWKKNNLVLRPYLYANTITRATGTLNEYNPDLFSPIEYPDLNRPEDNNVSTAYINTNNLFWYLRDANGTETLIDPNINYDFSYSYTNGNTLFSDKRFLVIKDNFIPKDSFVTIICKFDFYDPFAKIHVKQSYEIDLSCLSTGQGTNQLVINSVNGNTIYNSSPEYIDLYCSHYKNGNKIDIQTEIEDAGKSSNLYWYIRSSNGEGWILLDGTKQNNDAYNLRNMFEIRRYTRYDSNYNVYSTELTNSNRGGFYLRIHPALITGSNVIKAVYTSSDDKASFTALETVYDDTDSVQAYIHSSNGDKIYQGVQSIGTTLTCMVKYQGQLLQSSDERYENNFEYYWFKVSSDGTNTWNIWLDNTGSLNQQLMTEDLPMESLHKSSRILPIKADNVDNINMFQCVVVDKISKIAANEREQLLKNSPSEEDLMTASLLLNDLGMDDLDYDEVLNTAYEINAMNISNGTSFTS